MHVKRSSLEIFFSASLDSWATSNNLGLLCDPKEAVSFYFHRWNVGTNPVSSEISDFTPCRAGLKGKGARAIFTVGPLLRNS